MIFTSSLYVLYIARRKMPAYARPQLLNVLILFSVSKRSQSENFDLSELTSIVIKDLEEQYFDKKLLEREFKIFGANKVSLQPSKQSAVVTFTTHVSVIEKVPILGLHVISCI